MYTTSCYCKDVKYALLYLNYLNLKICTFAEFLISVSKSFHNFTPLYIKNDLKHSMSFPLNHGGKANWPAVACLVFTTWVVKI